MRYCERRRNNDIILPLNIDQILAKMLFATNIPLLYNAVVRNEYCDVVFIYLYLILPHPLGH